MKRKIRGMFLLFSCLFSSLTLFAQNYAIKGTVSDQLGKPIAGASVQVKGRTGGIITGSKGEFAINASKNDVIKVSFIGFEPLELTIESEKELKIQMKESAGDLDDIVVVGYGTQKKESVVASISTINPKELIIPVRSLSQSIAGRIAGVIAVQRSGEPGKDDAQFWIRGVSTFTGNQNPLVLVDGIERPLENVDPLEVESFSVLKDASATAVYGVRGANGVILVNTRKGFDGKARVDARYDQGFSFATKRPSFINSYDRALLYNESIAAVNGSEALKYSANALEAFRTGSDLELYPDVDWQELLMRDYSLSEKLSANISGGGKTARYFVATSFYQQDGQYAVNPGKYDWVPKSLGQFGKNVSYMRYNFRSNIDMDLSKYTTVSLGLQGNLTNQNEPVGGSGEIYTHIINSAPNAFPVRYRDGKLSGRTDMSNPYTLLTQNGYAQVTGNEIRANLTINQDLSFVTKGLSGLVRYAYDAVNWNNANRKRTTSYFTAGARDVHGDLIYTEQDASLATDYMNYSSSAWGNKSNYLEASFNYNNTFGDHQLGGLIHYNMRDYRNNVASNYISSLPNRSLGLAGRVTYGYKNRYLIEANLGWNGSENFPKGSRMGLFPSLAMGWVASEESFLKNNTVLTWLKFRGSYGQVGSDRIGAERFIYLSTLKDANGYSGFGENMNQGGSGVMEDRIGTNNVTWEVATKYNLGIELGLFSKLRINTDLFYERRDNIFIQPQVSDIAGLQQTPYGNLGKMDNKGFEVSAEYNQTLGDWRITGRGNFTFARNKIIENGLYYANKWQDVRGTSYGNSLYFDAMHLFSQNEIDALPSYYSQFGITKANLRPGDIRYRDVNDDGKITDDDRIYTGNPNNPEVVYGFGATVSYKNFDISFLAQEASNMSSYLNASWYFYPFQAARDPQNMGNLLTNFMDRWTVDNPNPHAFSPRLHYGTDNNNYRRSTWWLRNSSYLRLKNVELGYTLPKSWINRIGVSNARLYMNGVNLLTISGFYNKFWDPEVGADAYPIQRSVFLGLNVSL